MAFKNIKKIIYPFDICDGLEIIFLFKIKSYLFSFLKVTNYKKRYFLIILLSYKKNNKTFFLFLSRIYIACQIYMAN